MDAYKTIPFNEDFPLVMDQQTAHIELRGKVELYYDKTNPNNMAAIFVSLENTTISAVEGLENLPFDGNGAVGYYTESLNLQMGATEDESPLTRESDGPNTSPSGQSISSTVSLSAGFFSDSVTGSASVSNTLSQGLTDFRVINSSSDTELIQQYILDSYDGGKYENWESMIVRVAGEDTMSVNSVTRSAVNNYEIISQAIFSSEYRAGKQIDIKINMVGCFRKVWMETFKVDSPKIFGFSPPSIPVGFKGFTDSHSLVANKVVTVTL